MSMGDYNVYTSGASTRLLWGMADYISKKISKVKVEFTYCYDEIECVELIRVNVINNTPEVKCVTEPKLMLSYKTCYGINEVNLTKPDKQINWPIELKPESEVNISYLLCKEESEYFLSNENKEKKCRIFVTDTKNKKYYSKKI